MHRSRTHTHTTGAHKQQQHNINILIYIYQCLYVCTNVFVYVACVCTKCVKENVEKTFLFARFEIILICHTTYALQFVCC